MPRATASLVLAGTCLVAATYGLVRLAYGLYLPDVDASLGLGAALGGQVAAAGSVAYCVGAVAGYLAPQRPRALVVAALLTASLGSIGMALAPGAALFVPAAVLSSAGAGLASPGLVAIVGRNVSSSRADRSQAIVNAGTGPGLVAAGLLALLLLPHWRLGFVVAAGVTAVAGVAVLVLDGGRRAPAPAPRRRPALAPIAVPAVAAVVLGAASAVVWTYGRSHLVDEGSSATGSTLAWVALGLGGTATVLSARLLARRRAADAWRVTAGAVAVSIAALGLLGAHAGAGLVACALFGWGYVAASSALIAWADERLHDDAAAGTAALFVALVIGQAAGSAVAGALADVVGLPATFVGASVVALAAALVAGVVAGPDGQSRSWKTSGTPSWSSSRVSSASMRR